MDIHTIDSNFREKFYSLAEEFFDEEGIHIEKTYRDMADYENYTRQHEDGFVVLEYSQET